MASQLVVEVQLVELLGQFGEPRKVLEEAIDRFAAEHCADKIAESKENIANFGRKYGLALDRFQEKIETKEGFAEYVEEHIERACEFEIRELRRWQRILQRVSRH